MASAMTEVAVRLAEPDKMAAQSVASLGQTIRRQVAAMNDAISRALGRAGELEALVHNEVAALERSYGDNELRIRGLIQELASERDALANNSERVSETLRGVGAQVSKDIADAGDQATRSLAGATSTLANNLSSRGSKITEAIGAAGTAVDNKLAERGSKITQQLVTQGDEVTKKLDAAGTNVSASLNEATRKVASVVDVKSNQLMTSLTAIGNQLVRDIPGLLDRLDGEQKRLGSIISGANQNFTALENALSERTTQLDSTLKAHSEDLKSTLADRIKALDASVQQQSRSLEGILGRSTMTMNQVFAEGADALKKTTAYMTQQTGQASHNLSAQADALKNVSNKLLEQVHGLTQRFETQGQAIVSASQALDSSNAQINSILERRHAEIASLLDTVSTKAQALDKMMRSYSGIIEGSLLQVEERAKQVTASLAQETAAQANMTVAEIERLRHDARQHTEQAVAELTGGFHSITSEVANQLGTLTSRFGETTREMRHAAHSAADEIEGTRMELQRRMQGLPEATRHSQEAVRKAISDQLKALGTLSALSTGNGAAGNGAQRHLTTDYSAQPSSGGYQGQTLPSPGYNAPRALGRSETSGDLSSVTADLASRLGAAAGVPQPPEPRASGFGVSMRNPGAAAQDDGWSVGDLLARASEPDRGARSPVAPPASHGYGGQQAAGGELRLNDIASAIDQQTAGAVWQRFRRGERDIFSRQLYTREGQATFDEIAGRYERDPAFRSTVDRYIGDFERLLSDAERKGQNAQVINNYLTSETGRVYLMLAHASGRLR
jgi:ABC-type transporter Mla subunit MlaD